MLPKIVPRAAELRSLRAVARIPAFDQRSPQRRGIVAKLEEEKVRGTISLCRLEWQTLKSQGSAASSVISDSLRTDKRFQYLAERLTNEVILRDMEDEQKLARGIQLAVKKGVLPADVVVEQVRKVDVTNRTVEDVTAEITSCLHDAPVRGCVLTLQGLSGTGKGTTIAMLAQQLPRSVSWSNGNVFRCLTLLAVTYSEVNSCPLQEALAPKVLNRLCGMMELERHGDRFDVKIAGLGIEYRVSEIQNTLLKSHRVARNISSVAEVAQGEVIQFVQSALQEMAATGCSVLVEGREQTLSYIRTPFRFELVLKDKNLIGMRQAALLISAKAYEALKEEQSPPVEVIDREVELAMGK
eukprot:2346488-Amphidinium_carterae.1